MVADALQKHGIKKQAVQKVMDTAAANGKLSFKDYGKQRVCLASQSQFEIPDIDELDAMKKQNEQLQTDVASLRSHVTELEAGMLLLFFLSIACRIVEFCINEMKMSVVA